MFGSSSLHVQPSMLDSLIPDVGVYYWTPHFKPMMSNSDWAASFTDDEPPQEPTPPTMALRLHKLEDIREFQKRAQIGEHRSRETKTMQEPKMPEETKTGNEMKTPEKTAQTMAVCKYCGTALYFPSHNTRQGADKNKEAHPGRRAGLNPSPPSAN